MAKVKSGGPNIVVLFGMLLFIAHMVIIANDVQAVLEDPNQDNKPGEVLKLALDISRYVK